VNVLNGKTTSNADAATEWTKTIRPVSGWFDFRLQELWAFRDLIMLFVRRDFVAIYKQTILGPLWYLIQPVMMTLVFTVIFGKIAKLPTDGVPQVLFYLSGVVAWRYFADCLQKTANTFVANAQIFGKVYFPRLTIPISVTISSLIAFAIQLLLLLCFWGYYHLAGSDVQMNITVLLLPILILQMAALGLGCGIIISSLTIRYRDLAHLVTFGTQLWMYVTPVVYPASLVPENWQWLLILNPMAPTIEVFRHMFLGTGSIDFGKLVAAMLITCLTLFFGILLFSRAEKKFVDSV
jgi:lipopolysaccharide transport system permease protein